MLDRLTIQNYVIIDQLEMKLSPRLNVITGETGAGKSIIAGALGLILGERADTTALVNKEKKCVVEGSFRAENKGPVQEFLKKNELDPSDELLIRREIGSHGKSRAFINDTPVSLSQLQELASLLVDLHQQFDTLELGRADFQREVLDALASHKDQLDALRGAYRKWQALKSEASELRILQIQLEKEADYNRFQFTELEQAGFREDELEQIEGELKLLNNSEAIRTTIDKINFALQDSEEPVVQQLKLMANQLGPYASFHPDLGILVQRLQSVQVELQDIAADLDRAGRQVHYDPQQIEQLNERLSLGYRLLKKHGVKSTAELLIIQKELEEKLRAVTDLNDTILQKEKAEAEAGQKVAELSAKVSGNRSKQVKPFQEKVNRLLQQVGMPHALFRVEMKRSEVFHEHGTDQVEFLFDANVPSGEKGKTVSLQPLSKCASGGELSRLMLCVKSLVAESMDLPTLIFDEIDTGISGEAARQVGIIMKRLASSRQVVCITHQPQIAGKADAHFFVYKEIEKDLVKTNIRLLNVEERITTIAKMLGGEKPTAAAMENAREMLN